MGRVCAKAAALSAAGSGGKGVSQGTEHTRTPARRTHPCTVPVAMTPALGLLLGLSLVGALRPGLEPLQYSSSEDGAILFARDYNRTAELVLYESVSASWNYNTNLTDEKAALQVGAGWGNAAAMGVTPARETGRWGKESHGVQ